MIKKLKDNVPLGTIVKSKYAFSSHGSYWKLNVINDDIAVIIKNRGNGQYMLFFFKIKKVWPTDFHYDNFVLLFENNTLTEE